MVPPFPWGHWLYAREFERRCSRLDGDVIEAGVGLGGTSIFIALLIKQLGLSKRVVSVDTFTGLPAPNQRKDNPYFISGEYAPAADQDALQKFWLESAAAGVVDAIEPVTGLFADVLPSVAADSAFCFAHIDADLYDSVYVALDCLYDSVVPGGLIVVDDFFHPAQGSLRAATEFFNERGVMPLYHVVFPYSVGVIKGEQADQRPARSVDGNAYSLDWLRSDEFFVASVAASKERSSDGRAKRNADLLCGLLQPASPRYDDIYDYWRALEAFWEWIDVLPNERAPHTI
jgi:O-methyltransferase